MSPMIGLHVSHIQEIILTQKHKAKILNILYVASSSSHGTRFIHKMALELEFAPRVSHMFQGSIKVAIILNKMIFIPDRLNECDLSKCFARVPDQFLIYTNSRNNE